MGVVGVVTVLFASIVMHWLGPTCSPGVGVLTISSNGMILLGGIIWQFFLCDLN